MKTIRYLPRAEKALLRHRADARRIIAKMAEYAADPRSHAGNAKRLKGRPRTMRLRVGDFRVLFTEEAEEILVLDIGPRGSIYDE